MILRCRREKKSEEQLKMRVSGINERFNDLKKESIVDEEDDWLNERLNEDPDKRQLQIGITKK